MKFTLTRFENLALGDTISVIRGATASAASAASAYRVFQKVDEMVLWQCPNNGGFREFRDRRITAELETVSKLREAGKDVSGVLKAVERNEEDCITFRQDVIHFGSPEAVLIDDESDLNKGVHIPVMKADIGSLVILLQDGLLYRVSGKGVDYSHEYGGNSYEWPYLRLLSLPEHREIRVECAAFSMRDAEPFFAVVDKN